MMGNAVQFLSPKLDAGTIAVGKYGLVHITARNNMQFDEELGMSWIVQDPDGVIVENFGTEWEMEDPGEEHEFIGDRFPISKKGIYSIKVTLQMNRTSPITVDQYDGVLCVATEEGVPITYELLEETIYPYAYIYKGDCETSTFTFKTDPFSPANWLAGRVADAIENEVRKAGGKVMEMRVYVDKTPLLWTDWRVEVVGTSPQTTAGITTGIAWWGVAIILALVVIGIIAATLLVKTIAGVFKTKPGLDQVKVGWGKETLVMTIQDSEEYWNRPPTPVETLQAMSEGDLRHLLNQIAKEEVPTGVSWLPWAVIGGVAVLGVGAAVAISSRKR